MVRKEDLCDWFKALPAHKRVDYMCGLLHMCHPLELRFTGTVVEDLAKKDFHYLRDQEIKANQRSDLASNNNSNSLSDQKLRAKIITALALMNSTNLPCAEVIFEILQQQLDNLIGLLHNAVNVEDLIMILTMAVHHPAFTFYQKDRLGQVLERVERHLRELYGDDNDERDLILQSQTLTPETIIPPSSLNNSQSPIPQLEKVTVMEIKVMSAVPSQSKKGGAEYRIHTTWSNEEVTEVLLKFKQLQELHHKLLNRFPDERKTHTSVPVFPGKYTHKEESLEDQINSLNTYFSKLAKAPAHILDCDILTEPLRSGTLVYQPKSVSTLHTTPSATISPSQTQEVFIQTSPLREDRKYEFSPYRQPILMSYSSMVPHSTHSPGVLQMSSAANSPANSRNSSPVPLVSNPGGKSNFMPPGNVKVNSVAMSGIGMPQPIRNCDQISQLLHVLNMEEYYDNLKDYPFHQIMYMSKEEFAKAGLPADAQAKLKSRLDQAKPDFNGIVETNRFQSAETSPAFFPPYCFHPPFTFITPPYPQHFIHPSYAAQPGHISMLPSPHSHIQANENSPANSEASSPPPSPLQPMTGLPLDHSQGHIIGKIQPGPEATFHLMSASTAVTGDVSDGKAPRNAKNQQMDSSGSEEERATGYGMELRTVKNKGRARPQQSRSLPLINQATMSVSAMEAIKLTGMPISMSAPHSHPALMNAEPRTGNTPPLQTVSAVSHVSANPTATVVNGYISDPPPIPPHGTANIVPRAILSSRTYKTAQPAHTSLGVHKNIMNMPTPDISHPLPNLGKNGASPSSLPLHRGNLAPQSYASVPPTHVMGLGPVNFPNNNTLQLGPQPSPTQSMMPEGNPAYPMIMYTHPRGILTTMANSTAIMTTTQSHHTGPPMSHSPSPSAPSVCTDQLQASPYITEVLDPTRSEGSSHTPPVQTPVHIGAVKSQTNAGGTSSSTPSPPLVPATPKQVGTNDTQPGGRGPQVFAFPNGFLPPIIYHHQPHFPNGIATEFGSWLRLPQVASNQFPYVYGGIFPHQNISGPLHTAPGSSGPVGPTNQSHASGSVNAKSRCYNCGLAGHKASDCNEIRMENMSNTFHLSYKPSDPPA